MVFVRAAPSQHSLTCIDGAIHDAQDPAAIRDSCQQLFLTLATYLDAPDATADRIIVLNRGEVVADASPSELKSLAAARRIRCVTSMPVDRLDAIDEVHAVRCDGAATEILTNDTEAVSRALLNMGLSLSGREIGGAGLEEAFRTPTADPGTCSTTQPTPAPT